MKRGINKKAIVTEHLPWILIALAVLVVLVITAFVLKEKGISVIGRLVNLFKGR